MASSNQAHLASGHLIFLTIAFIQEVSIHMCMCTCVCVCVRVHACMHVCMCACMSLSQTSLVTFLMVCCHAIVYKAIHSYVSFNACDLTNSYAVH